LTWLHPIRQKHRRSPEISSKESDQNELAVQSDFISYWKVRCARWDFIWWSR
jgi:hypothetical protein